MDEEWRVSLVVHGQLATRKPVSLDIVRDLLRSRVGAEISVGAGKAGIFLYAATADAAGIAERIAHDVLAQQGLAADIRLERWDPSCQAWLDMRTELPGDAAEAEVPPEHERPPGRRRLRALGALIAAISDGIGGDWLNPGQSRLLSGLLVTIAGPACHRQALSNASVACRDHMSIRLVRSRHNITTSYA